ncbi:MAG TPA: FAD-dependent thymidylate synthase [Bryobacteraceae bacterium]|nr:FAD-dependent thymidylate synthase [Bryobacteraceae bacterium]
MAYAAKIIADSINPAENRLTTFEITFPRIVLAEFNTHRLFSRNSASSRAIPVAKMLERVKIDPFLPVWWGKNQGGMQAAEELDEADMALAKEDWLTARDRAVECAECMLNHHVHKQIANRLLEPFLWHTAIVSATDYGNFFAQRCDPLAQPEIRVIAEMMRDLYFSATPRRLEAGQWHLPYIEALDIEWAYREFEGRAPAERIREISVARCARVSYLTHDGKRDPSGDLSLFRRLTTGGHWSPFEHAAKALSMPIQSGNFVGFAQFRKDFKEEMRSYKPAQEANHAA